MLLLLMQHTTLAQGIDSAESVKYLSEITVVGRSSNLDIQQLPEIVGTSIYAGKKSSLIVLENVKGNVVNNTMRQVFAKVPGIQVWESDGSGIQIGIAARGLSPNRSWEFNVRQNGYDIAADPYGYPEAYYNPPLQAVQRVEIIRGQGALQYGPQFGGLLNYVLRNGSELKKILEVQSQQTIGSYALFNSFHAVGGKSKKFQYYSFYDHRSGDGYRNNSNFYTNNGYATIGYEINDKIQITAEIMKSHIRSQQPGGLLDIDLDKDIRKSYRSRNWMDIEWSTQALIAKWKPKPLAEVEIKIFGVHGDRNSVGFMPTAGIVIPDTIHSKTGLYNPRNLNTDLYRNYGCELKMLNYFYLWGMKHHLSSGIRYFAGSTRRFVAEGKGSAGIEYDMNLVDKFWTRDLQFSSFNTAFFLENIFRLNNKVLFIPAIRYEYIEGSASGRVGFDGSRPILLNETKRTRNFIISGIGIEYHLNKHVEMYGNISQAYRPVQFADLSAPPTTDVVDQQLKDSKGYNVDGGIRGKYGEAFIFDVSIYYLQYQNRIGTLLQQKQDGSYFNYRTNLGNSSSKGIEGLIETSVCRKILYPRKLELRLFSSLAFNDSKYGDFRAITKVNNQLVEINLRNKLVENAPACIMRSGFTIGFKNLTLTSQMSHTGAVYTDANNTVLPTSNGTIGRIPSYTVYDLTLMWKFKHAQIKAGVNNLTDQVYFTRRATGYPGPGLMPADGRTYFFTIGYKF